jgi:hypothetical protein
LHAISDAQHLTRTQKYIDWITFLISLSPSMPAYLENTGVFSLVMVRYCSQCIGFTDVFLKEKLEKKYPLIKKDDTQYAAITAHVRDKCTDAQYTMKQEASLDTIKEAGVIRTDIDSCRSWDRLALLIPTM